MFEFIGIVVVCWFVFSVIRNIVRSSKNSASSQYGLEARRIATRELFVPNQYFTFLTANHMEYTKDVAMKLRETMDELQNTSWPRLLALTVYTQFHVDCVKFKNGDPKVVSLFKQIEIEKDIIDKTLTNDVKEFVINHS